MWQREKKKSMWRCHRKTVWVVFSFPNRNVIYSDENKKCKRQVSWSYVHKWIYFLYHFTQYFFNFSFCYLSWSEKLFFYSLKPFCQSLTPYPWVKRLTYVEDTWACYDKIVSRKGMKKDFILFQDDWIIRFHNGRGKIFPDEERIFEMHF